MRLLPMRLFGGRTRRSRWHLGLIALVWVPSLAAQLEFAQEQIHHTASPDETEYRATFTFENTSEQTVTVESVRSTCGCTVPELAQTVYEPGETGELTAVFTYGQRTGRQVKTITVQTDQGVQRLILDVSIPPKWEVEPRLQAWKLGTARETKTVTVDFMSIEPADVSVRAYPEEHFSLETDFDPTAGKLVLSFTPLTLEEAKLHHVYVAVTEADGKVSTIPIYLRVY